MTTSHPATEFPVPANLPGFWQWDKLHCPRPLTPLTVEIWFDAAIGGFGRAMDEFACPVVFAGHMINGYGYSGVNPVDLGDETIERRVARYQQSMARVLPHMAELWEQEWLPSLLPGLDRARSLVYSAMSDAVLVETFEDLCVDFRHRWYIHGKINFVTVCASEFADFYNATFQPADPTEPYEALQGFPTRSLDAGRGLWRLSRTIRQSTALMKLFESLEPANLVAQLEGSDEGRTFVREFRAYLDEFGWRSDAFELADPTWREDPAIPLNALQGYIALDEDGDPDRRFQEAVALRERRLAEARARLAGEPERLARFNTLYEAARAYLPVTENHNYYIDQIGDAVIRLPVLELGRRLVGHGTLANVDDVFYLTSIDIRAGLAGEDQRPLVAERRTQHDRWSKVVPPATLGEPPPADAQLDAFVVAILKMYGLPPEPSRESTIITGIAASRGTVQGRAKVVRSLAEASKVEPGDILVCEMTMPPWTPLFSTVAAVVADTGGVLSHCAIVAREYGLPCVVQTLVGTSLIKDGMLLTVDGTRGVVRIDEAP